MHIVHFWILLKCLSTIKVTVTRKTVLLQNQIENNVYMLETIYRENKARITERKQAYLVPYYSLFTSMTLSIHHQKLSSYFFQMTPVFSYHTRTKNCWKKIWTGNFQISLFWLTAHIVSTPPPPPPKYLGLPEHNFGLQYRPRVN